MRLIDADRLLSEPMKSKYYHLKNGDTAVPLIDIKNAPIVDAVEVVRCKDCEHWGKNVPGKFDVGGTSWEYCCIVERTTPWKWFCGSAERKECDGNE